MKTALIYVATLLSAFALANSKPVTADNHDKTKTGAVDSSNVERSELRSPFAKMGIKQGDILLSVNGIKLNEAGKGLEAFQALNESKRSVIRVLRDGKEQTFVYEPKQK